MKIQSTDDVIKAMENTDYLAESLGFLPNDQLKLSLVTEEALVNAMEHGETGEHTEVNWQITDDTFVLKVKQKGNVFPLEINENINDGLRGRGLQLISAIMDEVWLNAGDGTVTLCMRKSIKKCERGVESVC